MSAEDILYWIYAAVTVFCMTYEVNDGILRGFLVTGFLAGAVLYRYAFGTFFVKYTTKFINLCLKPLKKALCLIKIGVHKITGCIKAAVIHLHKGAVFLSPLLLHTVLPVHKFPCHLLQFHPNPKCADFLTIPQPAEAAHTFL